MAAAEAFRHPLKSRRFILYFFSTPFFSLHCGAGYLVRLHDYTATIMLMGPGKKLETFYADDPMQCCETAEEVELGEVKGGCGEGGRGGLRTPRDGLVIVGAFVLSLSSFLVCCAVVKHINPVRRCYSLYGLHFLFRPHCAKGPLNLISSRPHFLVFESFSLPRNY